MAADAAKTANADVRKAKNATVMKMAAVVTVIAVNMKPAIAIATMKMTTMMSGMMTTVAVIAVIAVIVITAAVMSVTATVMAAAGENTSIQNAWKWPKKWQKPLLFLPQLPRQPLV